MEKRELGHSRREFAAIALGGNVFGWTSGEAMSHRLLDGLVDAGFSLVDTAEDYAWWVPRNKGGESESLIGSWPASNRGKRRKVMVATKCVFLPRERIRRPVEGSLRRLDTDCIDLFQSHRDDRDAPLEETLSTYGAPIREGKIRCIGASD